MYIPYTGIYLDWEYPLFTDICTELCYVLYTEFYTDLRYVFLHRVLHRFTEHISTQISTQICVTSLYTELYTESKYISTYFFQSSTQSWKTLFNEFLFLLVQFLFLRTVQFQYHFKIQRIDNFKTIFQICPTEFYRDISYILVQWEIISHLLQNFTQ